MYMWWFVGCEHVHAGSACSLHLQHPPPAPTGQNSWCTVLPPPAPQLVKIFGAQCPSPPPNWSKYLVRSAAPPPSLVKIPGVQCTPQFGQNTWCTVDTPTLPQFGQNTCCTVDTPTLPQSGQNMWCTLQPHPPPIGRNTWCTVHTPPPLPNWPKFLVHKIPGATPTSPHPPNWPKYLVHSAPPPPPPNWPKYLVHSVTPPPSPQTGQNTGCTVQPLPHPPLAKIPGAQCTPHPTHWPKHLVHSATSPPWSKCLAHSTTPTPPQWVKIPGTPFKQILIPNRSTHMVSVDIKSQQPATIKRIQLLLLPHVQQGSHLTMLKMITKTGCNYNTPEKVSAQTWTQEIN